jgi:putative two-component system response regulator
MAVRTIEPGTRYAATDFGAIAEAESLIAAIQSGAHQGAEAPWSGGPMAGSHATAKIMIVDDEPINIKVVRKYLKDAGFQNFAATSDDLDAMRLLREERPDLLLLDIVMPHIGGLEILRALRNDPRHSAVPVIILTAVEERQVKAAALELGASDFLTKPVDPTELVPRVRNVLAVKAYQDHLRGYAAELERQVQQRTTELAASRLEVIHCLGRAAEYRDNDTGLHVVRVGLYAGVIARRLGLDPATAELIEHAAPMHDVGKIGIPDAVLLKPGKLDADEFEIIRRHCEFGQKIVAEAPADERRTVFSHTQMGAKIMGGTSSPTLRMAGRIAMTHHEKWDGSGYPLGLKGEAIPVEGRITAVADVFDALASKRPYKDALPLDRCFEILEEGRGTHFDPHVLDAFLSSKDEVLAVYYQYTDPPVVPGT